MNLKIPNFKVNYFIKSIICFFIILSTLYLTVFFTVGLGTINIKRNQVINNENRALDIEKGIVESRINTAVSDLIYLTDIFHHNDGSLFDYKTIADEWNIFSETKAVYKQIRYIDVSGNELINIKYGRGDSKALKPVKFHNIEDNYYYKICKELKKDQVYIFKVHYDLKRTDIKSSKIPTIGFIKGVYDNNGKIKGVVYLRLLTNCLLEDFNNFSITSSGDKFILEDEGSWISRKNTEARWDFAYNSSSAKCFLNEYPDEWNKIKNSKKGRISTKHGVFIYSNIFPQQGSQYSTFYYKGNKILLDKINWRVISLVSKNNPNGYLFDGNKGKLFLVLLGKRKIRYLVILIVSIVLAFMLTINKGKTDEINRLSQQKQVMKEKEELYNRILELDSLKTEFIANISHELKTPLNVIIANNQLLQMLYNKNKKDENYFDISNYTNITKQNCYRLQRLINNLIDTTQFNSNTMNLNLRNENIINVVEDITLAVSEYVKIQDISVIFDTEIEEKMIAIDAEKIEKLLLNLLSNAVKFTDAGGEILVMIIDEEDYIKIVIKDSGKGIPKEKLGTIFQRFSQVDPLFIRTNEGMGIGLSLVKLIAEAHGGEISVISDVNKGSEFIVRLPLKVVQDTNTEVLKEIALTVDVNEKVKIEFSDIYL